MLERVRYINHLGWAVELNAPGIHLNTGTINDWALKAASLNGNIAGFTHEVMDKAVAGIVFKHDSRPALAKLDEMYEVAIVDTERNSGLETPAYGRLVVGDWYLLCWVRGGSFDRTYLKDAADFTLTLVSDLPLWTREKVQTFVAEIEGSGLDYPHDYPHDYTASWFTGTIRNGSPKRSPVRIAVAGPADNWHVRIAGNAYSVARKLDPGEMVVIDGRDETITHIDALGNETNVFGDKAGIYKDGSGSFIFETIPPGESEVEWDGVDKVEILVYEQREQRPFVEEIGS